jgi:hypothetical protein
MHGQRQLRGLTTPDADPSAFRHKDCAVLSSYVSLMLLSLNPVHGLLPLQSNFTATGVADVPSMSVYETSLIRTPELCRH